MNVIKFCFAFLLTTTVLQLRAADDAWPSLPKETLSVTNLGPRPGVKVKTESSNVMRGNEKIPSITKVDRNGDGRFEEFIFTAFVEKQRVISISRIGGQNESSMFFSFDDVMVMTDVRIPEKAIVALVIISREHDYYEIFVRQPEGFYWPADDEQRKAIDKSFRTDAEAVAPAIEKLKK